MFSGKDLVTEYLISNSFAPAARTSTANGTAIDLADTGPELFAFLNNGTTSGTSPTLDVKLQECDTSGGTYSDITGATFTQLTAAGNEVIRVANRTKRYVRAVATIAGTSPSFACAVTLIAPKQSY